jgi:hypothetical protein
MNVRYQADAYLDRLGDRPREIITTVDDPDFDEKNPSSHSASNASSRWQQ